MVCEFLIDRSVVPVRLNTMVCQSPSVLSASRPVGRSGNSGDNSA